MRRRDAGAQDWEVGASVNEARWAIDDVPKGMAFTDEQLLVIEQLLAVYNAACDLLGNDAAEYMRRTMENVVQEEQAPTALPDFTQTRVSGTNFVTAEGYAVTKKEVWLDSPGHFSSLSGEWSDGGSSDTTVTYWVGDNEVTGETLVDVTTSAEVGGPSATSAWLPEGAVGQTSPAERDCIRRQLEVLYNPPVAARSEKNTARAAKRTEAQARWAADQLVVAVAYEIY